MSVAEVSAKVERVGFQVVDQADLPPREARFAAVPEELHPEVSRLLTTRFPNGLYAHQAAAIRAVLSGMDVCQSTSTASGKSLPFMATAAHLVLSQRGSRVLALYPARALIQDQFDKWRDLLEPLGVRLGYIDGGVSTEARPGIIRESQVLLMTPDTLHSWLMSNIRKAEVRSLLSGLRLVILDEAHVYEGVFGTNMAYLLRRLQAVARPFRMISSTATIGQPEDFIRHLTGRDAQRFEPEDDCSARPEKSILLAVPPSPRHFEETVTLLRVLSAEHPGRFVAFGDSRKSVELLVAALNRGETPAEGSDEQAEEEGTGWPAQPQRVLPYRAGYETDDRNAIQRSLAAGELVGVVSTSGLELGVDIGEIDLVVLLGVPPSMKAFWQRVGRAGRRNPGACVLIDTRGVLAHTAGGLSAYLQRPLEPSWIYLENRYIQFANALCAAAELSEAGGQRNDPAPFTTLPVTFSAYLENEINPTQSVPADLYPLKQRAQSGPHLEFPLRSAMEKSFQIRGGFGMPLGNVSFPQALHEAYPGALYYYLARPYRITQLNYRDGVIHARRDRHWTTRPLAQAMVFPNFVTGILQWSRSEQGFMAETSMQVSERVLGFVEQRGSSQDEHRYGVGSPYSQRPLTRFFETTGVCWYFPERMAVSEATALQVQDTFCREFGVQERDLGIGLFHAHHSPLGPGTCQGICIFDATNGSLRLTEQLAEQFPFVVGRALETARALEDTPAVLELEVLARHARELQPVPGGQLPGSGASTDPCETEDYADVIAPGEQAIYDTPEGARDVVVLRHRYTPQGLYYDFEPHPPMTRWSGPATLVRPMQGLTRMLRVNLVTGETIPLS